MLVCEKVKQKNTTTYNEVADELVTEYSNSQSHLNDQVCIRFLLVSYDELSPSKIASVFHIKEIGLVSAMIESMPTGACSTPSWAIE